MNIEQFIVVWATSRNHYYAARLVDLLRGNIPVEDIDNSGDIFLEATGAGEGGGVIFHIVPKLFSRSDITLLITHEDDFVQKYNVRRVPNPGELLTGLRWIPQD